MKRLLLIGTIAIAGGIWAVNRNLNQGKEVAQPVAQPTNVNAETTQGAEELSSDSTDADVTESKMPDPLDVQTTSRNDSQMDPSGVSAPDYPIPGEAAEESPTEVAQASATAIHTAAVVALSDLEFELDIEQLHLRDARVRVYGLRSANEDSEVRPAVDYGASHDDE